MKVSIGTAYYNRPDDIVKLCKSLSVNIGSNKIVHHIIDDGSELSISSVADELRKIKKANYQIRVCRQEHLGKDGYRETMQRLFDGIRKDKSDFFIMVPDDVTACKDFWKRLRHLMGLMTKPFMLNLLLDHRFHDNRLSYFDGIGIVSWEIMENIDWTVPPPASKARGSGVWPTMTKRMMRETPKAKIFYPNYSLVFHNNPDSSVMNPLVRKENPIHTVRWIDSHKNAQLGLSDYYRKDEEKTDKRYAMHVHEGIGNVIQTVGLYLNSKHLRHDKFDVIVHGTTPYPASVAFYKVICEYFGNKVYDEDSAPKNVYEGQYDIGFSSQMGTSEAQHYRAKYKRFCDRDHLFYSQHFPLEWDTFRGKEIETDIDIVICDGGYSADAMWMRKKYQRYTELVKMLKDYKVASVGRNEEYVYGTIDKTNLSLTETFDLISSCKLFVSNDTGLYHFANVVGTQNIPIFTATSLKKNYDKEFHAFSYPVWGSCNSCQQTQAWRDCYRWSCCYQDPLKILNVINELLKGQ